MLHTPDAAVAYIKQAKDWNEVLSRAAATHCDADRRVVSMADGRLR